MNHWNDWLLKREVIEKRLDLVTGPIAPTDMALWYFRLSILAFTKEMVNLQDIQTKQTLMEKMQNQAVIISSKDGAGIVMFPLEDWQALRKEVLEEK